MWIKTNEQRPNDEQDIFYYFEPFGSFHKGKYDAEYDSVHGASGFASMLLEVPYWMPIPPLPGGE